MLLRSETTFYCIYRGFMETYATQLNLTIMNHFNCVFMYNIQAFHYLCSWSPNRILVYSLRQFDAVITDY